MNFTNAIVKVTTYHPERFRACDVARTVVDMLVAEPAVVDIYRVSTTSSPSIRGGPSRRHEVAVTFEIVTEGRSDTDDVSTSSVLRAVLKGFGDYAWTRVKFDPPGIARLQEVSVTSVAEWRRVVGDG